MNKIYYFIYLLYWIMPVLFYYDAWIEKALNDFAFGLRLEVGIFKQGTLIGLLGLGDINQRRQSASLSYALDGRFRRQGITTRCCRSLITYAYEQLHLNRLQILVDVANIPSCRVPESLGFTKEGVIRHFYRASDGFRDCALYSLLRHEWKTYTVEI